MTKLYQRLLFLLFLSTGCSVHSMFRCKLLTDPQNRKLLLVSLGRIMNVQAQDQLQSTEKILALVAQKSPKATLTHGVSPDELENIKELDVHMASKLGWLGMHQILKQKAVTSCEPDARWLDLVKALIPVTYVAENIGYYLAQFQDPRARSQHPCSSCHGQPITMEELHARLNQLKAGFFEGRDLTVGQFLQALEQVTEATIESVPAMQNDMQRDRAFIKEFFEDSRPEDCLADTVRSLIMAKLRQMGSEQRVVVFLPLLANFLEGLKRAINGVMEKGIFTVQLQAILKAQKTDHLVHFTRYEWQLLPMLLDQYGYSERAGATFCCEPALCASKACIRDYNSFAHEAYRVAERFFNNETQPLPECTQTTTVAKACAACGAANAKQRCGACKDSVYCNRTCQVNDWSKHKPHCKK